MKKLFLLFVLMGVTLSVNAQSWVVLSTIPAPLFDINSISVVDGTTMWVCGTAGNVRRSTNGGVNWTNGTNTGLPAQDLYGISALDAQNCWVGTVAGSIYKTTNGGTSWTLQFSLSGSFSNGIKMFTSDYGVYTGDPTASGQPYQMRNTTNGGTNWINSVNSPIAGSEFGVINAWDWTDTSHFWIGSANTTANATTAKIYRCSNGFSGTWQSATVTGVGGAQGLYFQAVGFINATSGMAGSNASSFVKTTDGGATFQAVTNPAGLTSFAVINMNGMKDGSNKIRAVVSETAANRMFTTTNLGVTWVEEILPAAANTFGVQHMQFLNASLGFAGGNGGTFYRYGPPVGVNPVTVAPESFSLEQNYPNPFNPSTKINYSVPTAGNVSIKIYNSVGVEIMTVVDNNVAAGNYSKTIDMSKFSTGIYFYTMKSGSFSETRKMMLVK